MTFLFQKSPGREESKSSQLDFEEFVHYLQDYEKDLKLVVKSLDKKHSGVKSLPPHYLFILSSFPPSFPHSPHTATLVPFKGCFNGHLVRFEGGIDASMLKQSLQDLGVHISQQHAQSVLHR